MYRAEPAQSADNRSEGNNKTPEQEAASRLLLRRSFLNFPADAEFRRDPSISCFRHCLFESADTPDQDIFPPDTVLVIENGGGVLTTTRPGTRIIRRKPAGYGIMTKLTRPSFSGQYAECSLPAGGLADITGFGDHLNAPSTSLCPCSTISLPDLRVCGQLGFGLGACRISVFEQKESSLWCCPPQEFSDARETEIRCVPPDIGNGGFECKWLISASQRLERADPSCAFAS
ncbi:hypothetical protein [Roseibium sediminicola]|uniref:Uncharacterized protein n=1 Tax=Roseibium sediminicola TaxID=2933272 RepID=A0ABT0GXX6_9HYPH|nr:hypothetical protein [Roseibium sp. CAU 1639]MCK7613663.1 hypothetical protein [Roseibium sp. CAU 1639]